jgi:hypothetical protein
MVDVRLRVLRNKVLQIAVVFLLALFSVGQLFIYLHCYLKAGRTVIHHHRELYSNVRHHGILPTTNNTEYTVTLPPGCKDAYYHNNISDQKFVLALNYWEQLTMATASLYDLVEFAKEWNARTVEPFTLLAEFWGLPSTVNFPTFPSMPLIYSRKNTNNLDTIFNMSVLNSDILCGKFNYPPLASFDEFINSAHRDIIILHFSFDAYSKKIPKQKYFKSSNCIRCLHMKEIKIFSVKLQQYLNQISDKQNKPQFRIKDAFCFNHLHITTPSEIAELCGFNDNDNITIIITVWRGYSVIPTKKYRLIVPKHALEQRPSLFSSGGLYALNDNVLSNSSAYLRKISHGKPFIAVHFRTAKIEKYSAHFCYRKTWKLISLIKKDYEDIEVKYFVDYGEYGSHSHEVKFGKKLSRRFFFTNKQVTPLHYNPKEFGGLADQGFVALVELSTIARAKVLLLVGGGSFQDQIYMNFKRNQNAAVAYKVCWTSKQEILEINVTRHH